MIAATHGLTANTVRAWRQAFEVDGLSNWGKVAKGRVRKPTIPEDKIARIVELTNTSRSEGHRPWSCRTMAAEVGVSKDTV